MPGHRFVVRGRDVPAAAAPFPREHRARVRRNLNAEDHEKVAAVVRAVLVEELGPLSASGHQRGRQAPLVRALRVPRVAVAVHRAVAGQVRPVPHRLLGPVTYRSKEKRKTQISIIVAERK